MTKPYQHFSFYIPFLLLFFQSVQQLKDWPDWGWGGELGEGGMSQQNKIPPRFGQKSIVSRMIDLRDKGEKRWCTMTVWSGLIPSAIKTHLHHTSRSRTSHVMMQGQNCMIYCGLMGILRHILLPKTSFEISIDTYRLINTGMLVERGRWHTHKKRAIYTHVMYSHFPFQKYFW